MTTETYRGHEIAIGDGVTRKEARRAIDAKIEAADRAHVAANPDERTEMVTTGNVVLDWFVLGWLTPIFRLSNRRIRRKEQGA